MCTCKKWIPVNTAYIIFCKIKTNDCHKSSLIYRYGINDFICSSCSNIKNECRNILSPFFSVFIYWVQLIRSFSNTLRRGWDFRLAPVVCLSILYQCVLKIISPWIFQCAPVVQVHFLKLLAQQERLWVSDRKGIDGHIWRTVLRIILLC